MLTVTLVCCWSSEYWPGSAPLSVTARILAFAGMAATAVLSIAISLLGLRIVKPHATAKRCD
jgi:hypothetical protein